MMRTRCFFGALLALGMFSSTAHAQADCSQELAVGTIPDCVTALDVTRERHTTFTVTWDYNRTDDWDTGAEGDQPASEVKEFLVRYQEGGGEFDTGASAKSVQTEKVRPNSNGDMDHEVVITGLTPGKTYSVGVSSTPKMSGHKFSGEKITDGVTDAAAAPDDVDGLMLTAGDMTLMAMWDEADGNGSDVTGYQVQYMKSDAADWTTSREGSTKDTLTMWTISNLENGMEYSVRVRAYSYAATSDDIWSDIEMATPMAGGGTPTPTPALPLFGAFALGAGILAAGRARLRRREQRQLTR
jgi:hypothetical protein